MGKKTVLITGASSGIGAATAVELSKDYRLILCGRNSERLDSTRLKCEGGDHLLWTYDLTEVDGIEKSISGLIRDNGLSVEGFAHCAGMIKYVPVKSINVADFEQILRLNVISAAILLKTLCSRKHNSGALKSVVFVSSNISNFGAKAHALYSSSKSALDGLMRSAAVELGPKVRVNSVLPGGVRTQMTEDIFKDEELVKKMAASYPLGLGEPRSIASAIKFLLSDDSGWITGQQICVDGGRTINLSV